MLNSSLRMAETERRPVHSPCRALHPVASCCYHRIDAALLVPARSWQAPVTADAILLPRLARRYCMVAAFMLFLRNARNLRRVVGPSGGLSGLVSAGAGGAGGGG